ncbi:MAG TPA: hypothetical protein VGD35_11990 [Chitinophaga sp.]
MNKILGLAPVTLLLIIAVSTKAQTRTYEENLMIPGQTEDAQGTNYMLLHKAYNGTPMPDSYVMGKISGVRGNTIAWNRKWTVEVNTASAYTTNRGSIISYNEPATLVTLTYNGESYMAVTIINSSSLINFSFTGYMQNQTLMLVRDDDVSNVQPFTTTLDPILIQGKLGIGTSSPRAPLDVTPATINAVHSILARLPEGDATGGGTFVGVQAFNTTVINGPSFALQHRFYGELNSAINFHRGGSTLGGFLSFSTNNGTERMRIDASGNVGIGTANTGNYKLAVEGTIGARRVKVTQETWPDYVFHQDYQLPSLFQVEQYIKENQHLPEIPSAAEVAKDGLDLGEMNKKLLQKVEELTLYLIDIKKELNELKQQNETLEKKIQESTRH